MTDLEYPSNQPPVDDELDSELKAPLVWPPEDFALRVMQALPDLAPRVQTPIRPAVQRPAAIARALSEAFVHMGVVGAGLLGLSQALAFAFGVWTTSSAW